MLGSVVVVTMPMAKPENARRPRPTRRDYRADALLALLLLVGSGVSALLYTVAGFYQKPAPVWLSALVILAFTAPLVVRRRHPELVALVIAAAFVVTQLMQVPELLFCNISLFVAIYSVGAWGENRSRATATRGVIVAGMFVWLIITLVVRSARAGEPTASPAGGGLSPYVAIGFIQIITNLLYFGAAWYFGERAWSAARAKTALEDRTRELAEQRELNSRRAVIQERLRIARDLHDVVAHHVSVMGVQAGAARRVIDSDHDQVVISLTAIESNARTAVSELHRMLSTLRDEGGDDGSGDGSRESATDSPTTRGIAQLPDLITDAAGTGLEVDFSTVGDSRPVPATTGVILYRIAQEALTNTLKHAGVGSHVDMRLRYLATSIEIELTDTGGRTRPATTGSGLGHVGMRERVDAVGGSLHIGPTTRGGFVVRATIPTADAPSPKNQDVSA
jgi:signal transduction histidine kinase